MGLAAALIHDPEVLILDEPTSGLDPNQIVEIRNVIKEQGKNKTVLFSSHILQEVQAICDRVIIINKGELVADDSLQHLLHTKQTNEVKLVVAKSRSLCIRTYSKQSANRRINLAIQHNEYRTVETPTHGNSFKGKYQYCFFEQ